MLLFVVVISIIHFCAGLVLYFWLCGNQEGVSTAEPTAAAQATVEVQEAPVEPASEKSETDAWMERLKSNDIVPQSMTEAAAHIARLDADEYCRKLIELEVALDAGGELDAATLETTMGSLKEVTAGRLQQNEEVADQIDRIVKPLNEPNDLAERLEQVLLDEAAQVETTQSNLASFDSSEDGLAVKLKGEIARLLMCAHTVRDGTIDILLAMVSEGHAAADEMVRVRDLDRLVRVMAETDSEIPKSKADGLILAAINVDHFGKANSAFGTTLGDRVMNEIETSFSNVADGDGVRVSRRCGADYVVRFRGVKKDAALGSLEEMCQLLSATSFKMGEESVAFTASGALIECDPKDRALDLLHRLDLLVADGRKTGPNRICVEGKAGNSSFEVEPGDVPQREVSLA